MFQDMEESAFTAKALSTLSDKTAMEILYRLKDNDLSFSEIQKSLNIDKGTLSYHIKKLIKAGVTVNYYQKRKNSKEYSFYQLTQFAKDLIKKFDLIPEERVKEQLPSAKLYDKNKEIKENILIHMLPIPWDSYIHKLFINEHLNKVLEESFGCRTARRGLNIKTEYYKNVTWRKNDYDGERIKEAF